MKTFKLHPLNRFIVLLLLLIVPKAQAQDETQFEYPHSIPPGWKGLGLNLVPKAVELVTLDDGQTTYFWLLESPSVKGGYRGYFYATGTPEKGMRLVISDMLFKTDTVGEEQVGFEQFSGTRAQEKIFVMRRGDLFGFGYGNENSPRTSLTFAYTGPGSSGRAQAYTVKRVLNPTAADAAQLAIYKGQVESRSVLAKLGYTSKPDVFSSKVLPLYFNLEKAFYPISGGYIIYRVLEHPTLPHQLVVAMAPIVSVNLGDNLPYLLTEFYEGSAELGWKKVASRPAESGNIGQGFTRFYVTLDGRTDLLEYETSHNLLTNTNRWKFGSQVIRETESLQKYQIRKSLEATVKQTVAAEPNTLSIEPGLVLPLTQFPNVNIGACSFLYSDAEIADQIYNIPPKASL